MSKTRQFREERSLPFSHKELDNNFKYANRLTNGRLFLEEEVGLWYDSDLDQWSHWISMQEQIFDPLDLSDPLKWRQIGSSVSTSSIQIGVPTDGSYGPDPGSDPPHSLSTAGLVPTDTVSDAFDKLDSLVGLLIPPKPAGLASRNLVSLPQPYSAKKSLPVLGDWTAGQQYDDVVSDTNPIISTSDEFFNANKGDLTAEIFENQNSIPIVSNTIQLSDSTQTPQNEGILTITSFARRPNTQPFWGVIRSNIQSLLSIGTRYKYVLKHSETGVSGIETRISPDDPSSVSIQQVSQNASPVPSTTRRVSGVPSMAQGDQIGFTYTVQNAVSEFYNRTRIGRISSTLAGLFGTVDSNPASIPTKGSSLTFSPLVSVNSGRFYSENVSYALTGWNSKDQSQQLAGRLSGLRIDTVSDETSRVTSGTGQFPSSGYGGTYPSDQSLALNEELMMINGLIKYPSGDFSSILNQGGGPNYNTGITGWSPSNVRWFTTNMGSITNASNFTFQLNNITGSWSALPTREISGIWIYVRVDGSSPTLGWIDANKPYSSGNPNSNGYPALVASASGPAGTLTGTAIRQVTFGTNIKTGNVFVRIGIPLGSNKTFKQISKI